ncbi:Aspartate racemase [Pedobacter sp. Bi27]|uniref:aspartate/glutamate racemase family protein n=1 Tax=unclassified Pedobacter TaxID=2628915 RepID=UPI001D948F7A|nr:MULTISPECIES: aspartate/glutamate racemase family protein [unclassified Pedobacter]CAH0179045.1 Aspartate racemase [Pedobacter sp. Bi27]CAH0294597.1 Aspartate racemase [Pedobacter sp. Bi36]CAH0305598.1 Aspartate racemase [Pedobacter sp. Bi126]
MRKIGLVGGISWVSTIDYYRFINEGVNERLGGLNFAECLIYSLNFGDVQNKTWEGSFDLLLNACESLKRSGAEAIVLCANTAHLFADQLQEKTALPIIHIGTETAKAITANGIKNIGLLGTVFTMEKDFYIKKLEDHGLRVLVPSKKETRDYIQFTLKEELGRGVILEETRTQYIQIINDLIKEGAEGIILGCTEIPMLISQDDFEIPVFDTTKIHCQAIVDYMLS